MYMDGFLSSPKGRSPIQKEAPNPHFRSTGSLISKGVIILPTQTTHYYNGNPSKWPYVHFAAFDPSQTGNSLTGWWLNQPICKNMSQIGNLPQSSGWKSTKKTLKPPPRWPLKNQPQHTVFQTFFVFPFAKLLNHLMSCKFRVFEIKWICGGSQVFFSGSKLTKRNSRCASYWDVLLELSNYLVTYLKDL